MKKLCLAALAAATLIGCSDNKEEESAAAESVRGVSDTEIKLGGMHDLSGVFAAFSSPAEIWLAYNTPRAPLSKWSSMLASSSSTLPGTSVPRSAIKVSTLRPVTYSAR